MASPFFRTIEIDTTPPTADGAPHELAPGTEDGDAKAAPRELASAMEDGDAKAAQRELAPATEDGDAKAAPRSRCCDRALACCCPCVPLRRRRRLCCVLCLIYLFFVLGGSIFAGVMVYKLMTEIRFVLCTISPCVPGAGGCEVCLDPDAPCAQQLDVWAQEHLALPMNITYVVYNPIFIPYSVERLVMHTSLEPLPPLGAGEMLAMDPLDGLAYGAEVACEADFAHYNAGWGQELVMICMSKQDAKTIGRLNAVQKGLSDEKLHVRVAIRTKLPVVGITLEMTQDASQYAKDFDFAATDQPAEGLAACSEVSGTMFGAPERVLALYALQDYEVSVCAPDAGEFATLTARTTEALACMASSNLLPGCWPIFRNGTFSEELIVSIPIEMYNSAGFNLTLDVDGSSARVYDAETGDYVATGYLSETVTLPARKRTMLRYRADIAEFIRRESADGGVLGLTLNSYEKVLNSPVVLEITSRATILGTTYNQQFQLSHSSLIGLASLNGCRCEVGPDPARCRTSASSYAEATAATFGG